jgi:hypothetical protein
MYNDRPIQDPRLQAALNEVQEVYRRYDLAGAVMLVSEDEAAFAYPLYTTWNMVVEDETIPLGFRFRVKQAEQGQELAAALALGTGHMLHQLKDFGAQTQLWMGDLLRLLKQAGVSFTHVPFNGRKLPRLGARP